MNDAFPSKTTPCVGRDRGRRRCSWRSWRRIARAHDRARWRRRLERTAMQLQKLPASVPLFVVAGVLKAARRMGTSALHALPLRLGEAIDGAADRGAFIQPDGFPGIMLEVPADVHAWHSAIAIQLLACFERWVYLDPADCNLLAHVVQGPGDVLREHVHDLPNT